MTFKNGLSDAEAEALAHLAEECAEVVVAVAKILRHGADSRNPDVADSPTNAAALEQEIGDVLAAVDLVIDNFPLRPQYISEARSRKRFRVVKYLHHAKFVGNSQAFVRKP